MDKPKIRARGRRSAPSDKVIEQYAEQIIAAQAEKVALEMQLERQRDTVAMIVDQAMDAGVATNYIGSLLTSPDKPDGLTRQGVYKLVSDRVDHRNGKPSSNGTGRR